MAIEPLPTVSIGLPVYNGSNYLEDCLLCLLRQTWEDFEIVISDNASTDATEEICRYYAERDGRIRYYRSAVNHGAAWNFNRVFKLSRGRFFRWAAHDDLCLPTYVESCLEVMEEDPEIVLCATQTGIVDELGREVLGSVSGDAESFYAMQGVTSEIEQLRVQLCDSRQPSERFLGILVYSLRCYEVYGLMRRETMERSIGHPDYCGGEKVWLSQLALWGKIHEVPEKLFFNRWHANRFSSQPSLADQNEHMKPESSARRWLPHQVRSTLGYAAVIPTARLSAAEALRCWLVWARFCLQLRKWGKIVNFALTGTADAVQVPASPKLGETPVVLEGLRHFPRKWDPASLAAPSNTRA